MTDGSDETARRAFVRALHESTAIADRIREAIADAPPKLVMLALSDLLQEHLTRLVMAEPSGPRNEGLFRGFRVQVDVRVINACESCWGRDNQGERIASQSGKI